MDINSAVGRKAGIRDEQIYNLAGYETSPEFSELERLALRLADAITATPSNVPESLFHDLRRHLSEEQLVELSSAYAWENYRARFNRVFDAQSQGFSDGAVCVLPAREPQRPA